MEDLQRAQIEWAKKRQERLDYINPKQAGGGAESAHRLVLPSAVLKR